MSSLSLLLSSLDTAVSAMKGTLPAMQPRELRLHDQANLIVLPILTAAAAAGLLNWVDPHKVNSLLRIAL